MWQQELRFKTGRKGRAAEALDEAGSRLRQRELVGNLAVSKPG